MNSFFQANAILSKLSKNYMELKKDLPIRPSEMGVLNIITQTEPPHTAVRLGEILGVSKAMIAAHLSVLERKGYFVKQQSAQDKRVFFVLPTEGVQDSQSYGTDDSGTEERSALSVG